MILIFLAGIEVVFLLSAYFAVQLWEEKFAKESDKVHTVVTVSPSPQSSLPTMQLKGVNTLTRKSYHSNPNLWNVRPVRPAINTGSSATLFHQRVSDANTQTYGSASSSVVSVNSNAQQSVSTSGNSQNFSRQSYAPMLTYNSPARFQSSTAQAAWNKVRYASARRSPGTGGILDQWEEWYQAWLSYNQNQGTDPNDLSGLEDWWYANYGNGANPDVYHDFYEYYFGMADGSMLLLFLLGIYAFVKTINLKKESV